MVRDLSTFQVIPVCPQHFSKCRTVCYYNFNFYFELYIIRDFDDDKRMQSGGWVKKKKVARKQMRSRFPFGQTLSKPSIYNPLLRATRGRLSSFSFELPQGLATPAALASFVY